MYKVRFEDFLKPFCYTNLRNIRIVCFANSSVSYSLFLLISSNASSISKPSVNNEAPLRTIVKSPFCSTYTRLTAEIMLILCNLNIVPRSYADKFASLTFSGIFCQLSIKIIGCPSTFFLFSGFLHFAILNTVTYVPQKK